MQKDEQIRDLSKIFHKKSFKNFLLNSERDLSNLQMKVKESKKVVLREPTPTPIPVVTQSRLTQTEELMPSPTKSDDAGASKELQTMMQAKVEVLEHKYQTIIEQKNVQIRQLIEDV